MRKVPERNEVVLVGTLSEGATPRYPLLGALLADNGMRPFPSFERALYVASEEWRQTSWCPCFLATFSFKKL
ncbi:MAG: hypothetical protein AAB581_01060 [Patescibacteria group bacterium]